MYRSDFEKLVIAQSYIKQLRIEKGELLAFIDELKHKIERLKQTPKTPIEVKIDKKVVQQKQQLKKQQERIASQRNTINDLIVRINKKENEF